LSGLLDDATVNGMAENKDQPRRSAISVRSVAKKYGRRQILHDVTFDVPPGLLVGIQGENGSGKSTLLKCLVGLLRPDRGEVLVGGRVGYCPQEPTLVEALTVQEQLWLFGAGYRLPKSRIRNRTSELLDAFNGSKYAHTRIDRLSGGTRQKVNLIGAILHTPDVLVLDEPYQGFDYETYLRFWTFAEDFRTAGGSVLVVSHMHSEKERFDAMLDLVDGRVTVTGARAGTKVSVGRTGDPASMPGTASSAEVAK
jgi:ABC-2 type transport system ATP-binding protein